MTAWGAAPADGGGTAAPDAAALASPAFAEATGVARVLVREAVASTMDEAHALGRAGAPGGTVVVADRQASGRGRAGRPWASAPGAGVWVTLLERPATPEALGVLSLRLGLALAEVLDPVTDAPVRVKWPNDLYAGAGKLGGILVEARWHGPVLDWVAIGVGINLRPPDAVDTPTAAVRPGTTRAALLRTMLPAMRAAARGAGDLTPPECAAWRARDLLAGVEITAPVAGRVEGITPAGALLVRRDTGAVATVSHGSVAW